MISQYLAFLSVDYRCMSVPYECHSKAYHENLITTMHAIACLGTPNMSLQDMLSMLLPIRRVWGYQRGNQNPYIEEEQTTQWSKEKVQKEKQRSTKHTYKTKDRVPRTLLKTGGELGCSGRVSSSCSSSDTSRVILATNPVISHEREKDREVLTTRGTYPLSFVTQIFHNGQPSHGGNSKTFEVMTPT